jgi:4-amino-4-deoxy-L-arabinose transferase-like glycosyltransferase
MESYGTVIGRHFSLSYLDQPPITWWLMGVVTKLFHSEAPTVVRAPFILLFMCSSWLLFDLTKQLFGARAAIYAIAAFNLCPLFALWVGALALTDGPEVFFVLASLRYLTKAIFKRDLNANRIRRRWIRAGLFFGLALASKYTAILLLPGLFTFLLTSKPDNRRWLTRPQPYFAGCAALIPLLPVLIWNAQHGWASFLFQGGRASPGDHIHSALMIRWLGMQVLYLQPALFVALVLVGVKGLLVEVDQRIRFFCCLAAFPLAFFPFAILTSTDALRGFHWGIIGWLMLFPPLGAFLAKAEDDGRFWLKKGSVAVVATFVAALIVLISHASTGWIAKASQVFGVTAFSEKDPVLVELFDWSDLSAELKRLGIDARRTFITGIRWEACAKAAYIVRDDYPFLCLARKNIHFSYIADPAHFKNWNAIMVDMSANTGAAEAALSGLFDTVERKDTIELHYFGRPIMPLRLYLAKNFSGQLPAANAAEAVRVAR